MRSRAGFKRPEKTPMINPAPEISEIQITASITLICALAWPPFVCSVVLTPSGVTFCLKLVPPS